MLTLIMSGRWSGSADVVVCHDADESTSIEVSCSTGHCCTEHGPESIPSDSSMIEEAGGCIDFNIAQLSLAPAPALDQNLQLQMSLQPVILFWSTIGFDIAPMVAGRIVTNAPPPLAPPQILIDPVILIA